MLLTGQAFPLPGEHRRGVPYDIGDWVNHPRALALDDLIIHYTRFAQADRPPMQSLAAALMPPAVEPAESREDATREELRERFMAVTQPAVDAANEAEDLNRRLADMDIALTSHIGDVELGLVELFAGRFQHHPSEADYAGMKFGRDYTGRTYSQLARSTLLYVPSDGRVKIVHSVRGDLVDPAGRMLLYAYFALIEHFGHRDNPLVCWEQEPLSVSLGSPEGIERELSRFQSAVDSCLDKVMKKATATLIRPKNEPPAWFQASADLERGEGDLTGEPQSASEGESH